MTNLISVLVYLPTIIFITILYLNMQRLSGKRIFYGVYIPFEFRKTDELINCEKTYKKSIIISGILFSVMQIIFSILCGNSYDGLSVFFITLPLLASVLVDFIVYYRTYKRILEFKNSHITEINSLLDKNKIQTQDIEFLSEKNRIIKKYTYIYMIPLCISIIIAIYAAFNYRLVDGPIPVHYGFSGEADSFVENTPFNYYSNIALISLVNIIIPASTLFSLRARIKINHNDTVESIKKCLFYFEGLAASMLILEISIAVMLSAIVLAPIWGSIPPGIMIACVVFLFVSMFPMLYFSTKLKRGSISSSYTPDDEEKYWIIGSIYNNPDDPSVFVQKRFGIGWTVNIGNIYGKLSVAAVIILIVVSIIFSIAVS